MRQKFPIVLISLLLLAIIMVYRCDCGRNLTGNAQAIAGHKAKCPKVASRSKFFMKTGLGVIKSVGGAKRLLGFDKKGNLAGAAAKGSALEMDTAADYELVDITAPNALGEESIPDLSAEPKPEPKPEPQPSRRTHMIPKRLLDYLPSTRTETVKMSQYAAIRPPSPRRRQPVIAKSPQCSPSLSPEPEPPAFITTKPNTFGLFRQYTTLPTIDPEETKTLADFCDAPTFAVPTMSSTG
ncbi:uncharacterized protein EV420DRAFT_1753093 [Desarmillaria tabescens]|uniref:Uncharacterized protein n=1 Tax=Armillaria tabescens TaxID=1929756 RepID=A0AA39JAR2_ARMTA|nr:uncharacterized protein EV420DRAFT_1753093 [Desarmillaria tabescens]KAK0438869.1 hypothetical protein EV420DRAFT_1753093 [Desarmillaria tabescens]